MNLLPPLMKTLIAFIFIISTAFAVEEPPPNVIVIMLDDMDFDEIGGFDPKEYPTFTGAESPRQKTTKYRKQWGVMPQRPLTPAIDRLMKEGMTFTQFRVSSPICCPSRYTALTGQYASRCVSLQKSSPLTGPADIPSRVNRNISIQPGQWHLGRGFQQSGYAAAIIGKWHLSPVNEVLGRRKPAFTDSRGNAMPGVSQSLTDAENIERIRTAFSATQSWMREQHGWDAVEAFYLANTNELGLPKALWEIEGNMDWLAFHAAKWVERSSTKPFFLYWAPNLPHGEFGDAFLKANPSATVAGLLPEETRAGQSRQAIAADIDRAGRPPETATSTWIDAGIAHLLKQLDDSGLAGRTIVVLTSDHQSRGKGTAFEGVRVPLIIRRPGRIAPCSRCDSVLSNVDLAPTLLELAGVPLPSGPVVMDGTSFAPAAWEMKSGSVTR